MNAELVQLIKMAKPMTEAEREEQSRNFVVGNIGLENPRVTREVVDLAAARMRRRAR
jgi:hypothetical protein